MTWKLLHEVINTTTLNNDNKEFNHNGVIVAQANVIVKYFNEYFSGIGSKLAEKIPPVNIQYSTYLTKTYSDSFAMFFFPFLTKL